MFIYSSLHLYTCNVLSSSSLPAYNVVGFSEYLDSKCNYVTILFICVYLGFSCFCNWEITDVNVVLLATRLRTSDYCAAQ